MWPVMSRCTLQALWLYQHPRSLREVLLAVPLSLSLPAALPVMGGEVGPPLPPRSVLLPALPHGCVG